MKGTFDSINGNITLDIFPIRNGQSAVEGLPAISGFDLLYLAIDKTKWTDNDRHLFYPKRMLVSGDVGIIQANLDSLEDLILEPTERFLACGGFDIPTEFEVKRLDAPRGLLRLRKEYLQLIEDYYSQHPYFIERRLKGDFTRLID